MFDEDFDEAGPGKFNFTLGISDHHGELRNPRKAITSVA
jgi:hypothetical protein